MQAVLGQHGVRRAEAARQSYEPLWPPAWTQPPGLCDRRPWKRAAGPMQALCVWRAGLMQALAQGFVQLADESGKTPPQSGGGEQLWKSHEDGGISGGPLVRSQAP